MIEILIISFSGRKGSGKSTLANLLLGRGYTKISFADRLKNLLSELYEWEIESLQCPKRKEETLLKKVVWDKEYAIRLGAMIGAKCDLNESYVEFNTRRDALQYIGTDILRTYDPDFHINELKKQIKPELNYVLDDVRFYNELSMLKQENGFCLFTMRPFYFIYNNHSSEITLSRKDFDWVILNTRSEKTFIKTFESFYENIINTRVSRCPFDKNEHLQNLHQYDFDTTSLAKHLGCSRDKINWWSRRYLIHTTGNKYRHNQDAFLCPSKESSYWAGVFSADGTIKKHLKNNLLIELTSKDKELIEDFRSFLQSNHQIFVKIRLNRAKQYCLCLSCPYITEDMKLWCIEPRKSKFNKVPDCIKQNDELLPYWIVGLIDGDGSIFLTAKGRSVCIAVLASKEIIDFIAKKYSHISSCKNPEKNIENLFNLKFHGKNAVAFYKEIYKGIGLSRKWKRVEPFLNKKWHH